MSFSDIVKDSALAATQALAIENNLNIDIPEGSTFQKLKQQWVDIGFSEAEAIKMAIEQEKEVMRVKQ